MENKLHISVSPHIHSKNTTQRIMLDVLISLLPATIAGVIIFGLNALLVIAVCVATSVLGEFVFNKIVKKPLTIGDLSAAVTGLLLALTRSNGLRVFFKVLGIIMGIIMKWEL